MTRIARSLVDFVFGGKPVVQVDSFFRATAVRSCVCRFRNHLTPVFDKRIRVERRAIIFDLRQTPCDGRRAMRAGAWFRSYCHAASLM